MIKNANVFQRGKSYPPRTSLHRVALMERYLRWSQGNYVGLDPTISQPRQLRFTQPPQAQRLQWNGFHAISIFWSQAVGTPTIEYDDANPRVTEFLQQLSSPLAEATKLVVYDMIRMGVGCYYNRHALIPEALSPMHWFPISEPWESDKIDFGEVVAIPFSSGDDEHTMMNDRVYIAEHIARPTARIAKLDGLTIGETERQLTGFKSVPNAVVPVAWGEGRFGRSDYEDARQWIADHHRRASAISEALDLHCKPHIQIPAGALSEEDDGSISLNKDGMVIPIPEGERLPASYLQWQADFTAHREALEMDMQMVLRSSQIAPILYSPGTAIAGGTSLPVSGSALRRLSVVSTNRLRSIRETISSALKRVIPAQAQLLADLGGERLALDGDRLNFLWPPEFSSIHDEADALNKLIQAGALTEEKALQITENITRLEAENIVNNRGGADASRLQDTPA